MAKVFMSIRHNKDERKVYHLAGCQHIARIKNENLIVASQVVASGNHYHRCKCCFSERFIVKRDLNQAIAVLDSKGLAHKVVENKLFVFTANGCWQIRRRERTEEYILLHRNGSIVGYDFKNPELEKYHQQLDHYSAKTIQSHIDYLYNHDKFKQAIQEGKSIPCGTKRQRRYNDAYRNKVKRNSVRNVFYLFDQIEKTNVELKKASFC